MSVGPASLQNKLNFIFDSHGNGKGEKEALM
jgi:hypothetical protein